MRTDQDLMSAAADGDMDAFEELVLHHQHAAVRVAYRLLSHEEDARDAAQEAFLRILESASRYRPTASFRTYLYHILTRICIDHLRRRSRRERFDVTLTLDPSHAPPEALERNERAERVRAAIRTLPPRQRVALVLKHYEGMSYAEIAEAMQTSRRAVDSMLARARQALKEMLADLL